MVFNGTPGSEFTSSDQSPLSGASTYRLYLPALTFWPPISMSPSVVRVVTWLTPARQTRSWGSCDSRSLIVRLLSEGWPYSTETFLPPTVAEGFPRGGGGPCANTSAGNVSAAATSATRFLIIGLRSLWPSRPRPDGRRLRERLLQQLVD